jgi:LysM repeat protein
MKPILLGTLIFCVVLIFITGNIQSVSAQAGDAWNLIASVNSLRASYGLPPFEVNSSLMAAAQAQSDWQMQIGSWSHSGPGGSRPHNRAIAAGYGGGAQIYVTENVAVGVNLSPHKAVYEIWQDGIHLEAMISSRYRDVGAGVAISGDTVYYTLVVGYIIGQAGTSSPANTPEVTPLAGATTEPTRNPIQPIQIATQSPDGSIQHAVESGQVLIKIAEAYGIPLRELQSLNGLNDDAVIYPGDKLIIKPPFTPTPTEDSEVTPTETPNNAEGEPITTTPEFKRPTRTPRPIVTEIEDPLAIAMLETPELNQAGSSDSLSPSEDVNPDEKPDYLLITIAVLAFTGSTLLVAGNVLKGRKG